MSVATVNLHHLYTLYQFHAFSVLKKKQQNLYEKNHTKKGQTRLLTYQSIRYQMFTHIFAHSLCELLSNDQSVRLLCFNHKRFVDVCLFALLIILSYRPGFHSIKCNQDTMNKITATCTMYFFSLLMSLMR